MESQGPFAVESGVEKISDDDLVTLALKGQRTAFEAIMRRHNQRCFRIARSYLHQDADAMDVVQDAYVQIFTHLGQYKGANRLAAWIGQIVRNAALMRLRSNPRVTLMVVDDVDARLDSTNADNRRLSSPETDTEASQLGQLIEQCVDLLPQDFREVFMLRGVEQLSVQETSELIGILPETVKTRYHRARKMMQKHIQNRVNVDELDAFSFAGHRCQRITRVVLTKLSDLDMIERA